MGNSVAVAKQDADKNFCTVDDVEIIFGAVQDIYTVTDDGQPDQLKETYSDESEFKYYYCHGCETDWSETLVQTQKQAWKLVRAHLHA